MILPSDNLDNKAIDFARGSASHIRFVTVVSPSEVVPR